MRTNLQIGVAGAAVALAALWPGSSNANRIVNGGFEDGVYSSTKRHATNPSVPVGWIPNAGYDTPGNFNSVVQFDPHTGSYSLAFGNDPGYPVAGLWQKIRTAVGRTYVMNFYIGNVHPTGYFAVMVNSCVEATIVGDQYPPSFTITYADGRSVRVTPAGVSDYTLVSFSFAGTGRDRVGFSAVNDDASYLVDDVSVAEAFAHGPGGRARRGAACGGAR